MLTIVKNESSHLLVHVDVTEANLGNADEFKKQLTGLLDERNVPLVLDMQQVAYVDSSFLGALVASLKHAIALKVDITLVNLQSDIADLLKLIRLDKVFKIYPSYTDLPPAQ